MAVSCLGAGFDCVVGVYQGATVDALLEVVRKGVVSAVPGDELAFAEQGLDPPRAVFEVGERLAEESMRSTRVEVGAVDLDLDPSSSLDVVFAAQLGHKVAWQPQDGAGVFGGVDSTLYESTFGGPRHVAFGDWDEDGDTDIVVAMEYDDAVVVVKRAAPEALSLARASGLPVGWLHYGLLAALSLCIVATLSAVGIILAIGLLIAPGAIAFLVTKRLMLMLPIAV